MRAHQLAIISTLLLLPITYHIAPSNVASHAHLSPSIEIDGLNRSYTLHTPVGDHEKEVYPLIIALHGGGGTAKSMVRLTQGRFNRIANRDGAYVVYPEAIRRHWNEGRELPISFAHRNNVNDVGFIRQLITSLINNHPIDPERVFVTGMSNGGLMAYKLACAMPEMIAAIAPVTATIPKDILADCSNVGGTGLMIVNGTEDPYMPYKGGTISILGADRGEVISTGKTVNHWLLQNGCPVHSEKKMMPNTVRQDETTVTQYFYSGCESGVKVALYRVEGGGHTWPGGRQYLREDRVGKTSKDFNACEEIWQFFERF
ncbi:MAG: PHB depolymerase family esterase [Rhodothermales bacterium]